MCSNMVQFSEVANTVVSASHNLSFSLHSPMYVNATFENSGTFIVKKTTVHIQAYEDIMVKERLIKLYMFMKVTQTYKLMK